MKALYAKYHAPLLLIFHIAIYSFILHNTNCFAQCADTVKFTDWNGAGQSWQSWSVLSASEVEEVDESIPPMPNFFISDQDLLDVKLAFDALVLTSGDDDFIGIVLGFQDPVGTGTTEYRCILFDWKSKEEDAFSYIAEEGYSLSEFHGSIDNDNLSRYFWGHNGFASNSNYDFLAKNYGLGKGWIPMTNYHFEVTYTAGKIIIEINGNKVFDVEHCNQAGRIGFYTYSQHEVIFSNLTLTQKAYAYFDPPKICAGDSLHYTAKDEQCGVYSPAVKEWKWDFGDGSFEENTISGHHAYNSSGIFKVQYVATFQDGCTDTVTGQVQVQEALAVDLGHDTTLTVGSSISLNAGPDQEGWIYEWPDGSGLNTVTLHVPENDTTIWVRVTKDLCSAYDEIKIYSTEQVPPSEYIYVPNAFTPNGDGINDRFTPAFKDELPEEYTLYIYNRWGQELFESSDPVSGWDGTLHQVLCPPDIYVYLLKFTTFDQNMTRVSGIKKGTVMLVR